MGLSVKTAAGQITLSMSGYFCQSICEFRWCLVVEKSLMVGAVVYPIGVR